MGRVRGAARSEAPRWMIIGALAVVPVALHLLAASGVRVNLSESMPIGVYLLEPATSIHPGEMVIACPSATAQTLGLARGYLAPSGSLGKQGCSAGSQPVLKYVIALPREFVTIGPAGLSVNGRVVDSQALKRVDRHGRALAAIRNGRYRLGKDEVWLYSSASHSWDSRYFGPVKMRDVAGTAKPLLILPLPVE